MPIPSYNTNNYTSTDNTGRYQYPQAPVFNGYASNNLLNNSPYNNYMGMNGNFQTMQNQNSQISNYLKCRPVSSQEEAKACQIDLDGSLWVFTDVGNKKIYTKQVDQNGLAVFNTYALVAETPVKEIPQSIPAAQYITKKQFDETVLTLATAIKELQNNQKKESEQVLLELK